MLSRLRSLRPPSAPMRRAFSSGPLRDPRAILDNSALRHEALNREINETYRQYAHQFQTVLDPSFTVRGTSAAAPTWYVFAAYSSKVAGQAELMCQAGLDILDRFTESRHRIHGAVPEWSKDLLKPGLHLMDASLLGVMVARGVAQNWRYRNCLNTRIFLDPRVAGLAAWHVLRASNGDVDGTAHAALNTLRNTLEDANREAFSCMAVGGHDYLAWRTQQGGVTPDKVLREFSPMPEASRALYDKAVEQCKGPVPREVPCLGAPPECILPAAFALFERARGEEAGYRDRLIEYANNLLLFREQYHGVQPAYNAEKPGELNRMAVMQAVTPAIRLPLGEDRWDLAAHAGMPRRLSDLIHPPVSRMNWGDFCQRWGPILEALQVGYRAPEQLWPLPDADPAVVDKA